ncbi:hypothetical protein [Nocardiopsis dassonvillei]|uniref:hypothetical protein n=1 Tax=Nocardiopsis dassonvillei TaxID=2014 RepID=UPI00366F50F9
MTRKYRAKTAGALTAGALTAGLTAAGALGAPAPAAAEPVQGEGPVGLFLEAGEAPRPGEEFTLRTTVTDGPVEGALLAQHVPGELEIVEVGEEGVVRDGIVNWRVTVPEGEEAVYTVRVRAPEATGERLTSTACLLLERDADPAACASDSVLVAEQTAMSRVSEYADPANLLRAVGVALAAGLAWMLWRRRRALSRG